MNRIRLLLAGLVWVGVMSEHAARAQERFRPLPGAEVESDAPTRRPRRPIPQPGVSPGGDPVATDAGDPNPGAEATAAMLPPIVERQAPAPLPAAFAAGRPPALTVIRSAAEAAAAFPPEAAATLARQVDFSAQFLLLFAWQGSGGDRLGYAVAESYPEQIHFTYTPGRTRDLRSHVKLYALRADVRWTAPQAPAHRAPQTRRAGDTPVSSDADAQSP